MVDYKLFVLSKMKYRMLDVLQVLLHRHIKILQNAVHITYKLYIYIYLPLFVTTILLQMEMFVSFLIDLIFLTCVCVWRRGTHHLSSMAYWASLNACMTVCPAIKLLFRLAGHGIGIFSDAL